MIGLRQRISKYSCMSLFKVINNLPTPLFIRCHSFSYKPQCIELDYDYLCNKSNQLHIKENIQKRNSECDLDKVLALYETLKDSDLNFEDKTKLRKELEIEALKIPNRASPHLVDYGDTPCLLKSFNEKPSFNFKPNEFHSLVKNLNLLRIDNNLSLMVGGRSYILKGELSDLERALIRYSVSYLRGKGFTLISVPDILCSSVIESCGMQTQGPRSQVYHLSNFPNKNICLSGTAEMALGGGLIDQLLDVKDLPLKLAAVSRCYREEVGQDSSEKGIYRVHQFNKVEMFAITANETGEESKELYEELIDIQLQLFSQLGFHFQVLDMPVNELGNPAFCKTDIEAWIPVKRSYGEISSTSNCLDYQSRRLNLRYKDDHGKHKFPHTLNGTACATPRVLMTLAATHQKSDGAIAVPEVLQPFMKGLKQITKTKALNIHHFNHRQFSGTIVKTEEIDMM